MILLVARTLLQVLADPVLWSNALTFDGVITLVRHAAPTPEVEREAVDAVRKAALYATHNNGQPQRLVVEALVTLTAELAGVGSPEALAVAHLVLVMSHVVYRDEPTNVTIDAMREDVEQLVAPDDTKTRMLHLLGLAASAHVPNATRAPLQTVAWILHQAVIETP